MSISKNTTRGVNKVNNYLFKFSEKPQFIEEFRSGHIRLMSAYYYATLEKSTELYSNRYDATEGEVFIINSDGTQPQKHSFSNGSSLEIGKGVQRMLINSATPNLQNKISSYYLILQSDIPDGKFKTILTTMEKSLGDYYIFFSDPAAFAHRVKQQLLRLQSKDEIIDFSFGPVKYKDIENLCGFVHPSEKPDGLSWQHEFRLLVSTKNKNDPFYIDIGDIRDITIWGKKSDLLNGYISADRQIYIPNHYC